MHVQVSLKIELAATASLSEMEQQIQQAGHAAMREAMKQAIRHWEDQQQTCPHCGHQQRRVEGTVRRTIAPVFGGVQSSGGAVFGAREAGGVGVQPMNCLPSCREGPSAPLCKKRRCRQGVPGRIAWQAVSSSG
jgi:hypothetical protein